MHDAKTNLSRYVQQVLSGEEIVIANHGTPVARLVPYEGRRGRVPGAWKGQVWIAPDFDESVEDEIALWYGGASDPT